MGDAPVTTGTLLGGKVVYRQFPTGNRTGLEPVLMAAFVPARAGEVVLEGGCGAGAGLLCLTNRVPRLAGVGLEQDPATASLARHNLALNGRHDLRVRVAAIPALPDDPLLSGPGIRRIDHAFANPPWHGHDSSPSPHMQRDLARRLPAGTLAAWVGTLSDQLRHHGTLTLALPASLLSAGIAAMERARLGRIRIFPFWPRQGHAARIVLVQGRVNSRAGSEMLPGLVLHEGNGEFTPAARAVLEDGAALQ
ncbi:tRNA1(Val) (adenine(37)-N6)-methyltransferase [Komagataeibacter oboediens]|uniref:N-6 DNA methylase n=1 Tax=Komagataeibacter oboediens TaxID=65958 RepID=A0ABS5SQF3_9PROT|nr:N-6 DNA methylase [Komagataeibacter oboediens]MBL7233320.1 N-6 DNA methylase [Komagataeibacter oboediens]MBT0676496.1 N-6 DNA methylase [Komagataeibacter oboediens]MBT0678147.1 N-6 DNA methylase [Komagataeibacter oboediens]MBV0887867.1 N-6 DNA methylase [Komagataeibacter oboediens]MBV1824918.1 N-6 DNA methylase [Komagataeibacter oboediens]